jgi:hypothetical protein
MITELSTKIKKASDVVLNHDFLLALALGIILIVFTIAIGTYNNRAVTLSNGGLAHYTAEPNNPLKLLSGWDGPNYIRIATTGYSSRYLTNFFPLYPLLSRAVNQVISSPLDSALFVSWVSFVLAIFFYLKLLKKLFKIKDNKTALYGLAFFLVFPTSVFLIASYNTSLLAFLSLGAIYFALMKRPLICSIFGFFATMTHLTGVFVVIAASLILLENKIRWPKVVFSFLVGMLGICSYSLYLYKHFNNAFSFVSSQKVHGWLSYRFANFFNSFEAVYIFMFILVIISIIYWWNKRRSFSIYSFLFLLIPFVGGQFGGFNRYILIDFPIALMAYEYLKNKRLAYTVSLVLVAIVWTYYVLQYVAGYTGG